jgi:hypothetical protein
MKVTTDTAEMLIIDDRPVILGLALIAFILVFVGIGLGLLLSGEWSGLLFALIGGGLGFLALWAFVRRVQVVFLRPDGWVELRRKNLFGGSRLRLALDEIDGAVIEESSSSDGGATYRVALVAHGESAGHHPLTLAYSNVGHPHEVAAKINAWLGVAEAQAAARWR